jgi:hypothetical protein
MVYSEIIAVCSEIHTKQIIKFPTEHSTHTDSVIQTSKLMLYSEIIAVCSEIHTKHINTVRTAQ